MLSAREGDGRGAEYTVTYSEEPGGYRPTPPDFGEFPAAWIADVDRMSEGTVWLTGCDSWYLDATGRNAALWPGSVPAFQRRVAWDPTDYAVRPA